MAEKVHIKQTIYGTIRSDSPPKKLMLLYTSAAVIFGFFAVLGIALFFIGDGGMEFIMTGVCVSVLFIAATWFSLYCKKKLIYEYDLLVIEARREQREYQREHPYPEAEELFKQIRALGINDLDSKANVSRLLLYAKNNGITTPSDKLIEEFNIGKQFVESKELKERLNEIDQQEKELEIQCNNYSDYTEQDKLIRICQDNIKKANKIIYECEQDETSVRNGGEATYSLGRQKESSWAIHGGIANGIAGGAAGFAVATGVERRNQEIRQQNEQLSKGIAALTVLQLEKIWERKTRAENDLITWTARLDEAKMLLTEKKNQEELLSMLVPWVVKYEITETGAIKLKVDLNSTPNLFIFDDVKAVVDGSIKVLVKIGNEVVGSAICVLPYGGMNSPATVNCICRNHKKRAQEYSFDFVPHHLWAVEAKKEISNF